MAQAMLCVMRTFGWGNPTFDAYHRFLTDDLRHDWALSPPPPDAAVDRAREGAAMTFLATDREVLVFIDADVAWGSTDDVEYLADKALETKGVVGGMVSKKAFGGGWGGRFIDDEPHELFTDEMVELGPHAYLGSAFMAIHRSVFEAMVKAGMPWCPLQHVWPFFQPCVVFNEDAGYNERLSEDWAFCHHARLAGKGVYALMKPVTFHYGQMAFTALDGAPPQEVQV